MEILILAIVSFLFYSMIKMKKSKGIKMIGLFMILSIFLIACSSDNVDPNVLEDGNVGDIANSESHAENNSSADEDSSSGNTESKKESSGEALPEMKVHFINVGQADSALIQYDNHNILIDAGDWQGNEVVPYLKKNNVEKLDLVVGSHPHADHIGQIDKVLSSFEVDEVWMSGGVATSQLFERVLTAIESSNASYNEPRAGEEYAIGNLDIEIFGPSSLTGDLNDDSIVMRLTYGDVSFMFTGDAEVNGEAKIVNSGKNLESTVLKAGHHGSDTSTTKPFLSRVNPEVVVVSVAEKSKYNHPNKTVIDRINEYGAKLYATKTHGNIVINTDGKSYEIATQSEGTVTPGDDGQSVTKAPSGSHNKTESKSESVSKPNSNNNVSNPQPSKKPSSNTGTYEECVNINTANKDELQNIKHIGEERANLIIERRNKTKFDSINDLDTITGIGAARLAEIKEENIACVR